MAAAGYFITNGKFGGVHLVLILALSRMIKGKNTCGPVLIIKGFSREVCLCVPLTTREKKGKFYRDIDLKDGIRRKVILSQIRLIDTKRLLEKVSTIDAGEFRKIKQAIIGLIE